MRARKPSSVTAPVSKSEKSAVNAADVVGEASAAALPPGRVGTGALDAIINAKDASIAGVVGVDACTAKGAGDGRAGGLCRGEKAVGRLRIVQREEMESETFEGIARVARRAVVADVPCEHFKRNLTDTFFCVTLKP